MSTEPDPASVMLLDMAERDYAALGRMAMDQGFADEIFGFHAQQAVEKAAKAMLAYRNIAFERTHDLETLFGALVSHACIGQGQFDDLLDLTDFAVQYRYQAFDSLDCDLERDAIVKRVREFLDCAASLMHPAGKPNASGLA